MTNDFSSDNSGNPFERAAQAWASSDRVKVTPSEIVELGNMQPACVKIDIAAAISVIQSIGSHWASDFQETGDIESAERVRECAEIVKELRHARRDRA